MLHHLAGSGLVDAASLQDGGACQLAPSGRPAGHSGAGGRELRGEEGW